MTYFISINICLGLSYSIISFSVCTYITLQNNLSLYLKKKEPTRLHFDLLLHEAFICTIAWISNHVSYTCSNAVNASKGSSNMRMAHFSSGLMMTNRRKHFTSPASPNRTDSYMENQSINERTWECLILMVCEKCDRFYAGGFEWEERVTKYIFFCSFPGLLCDSHIS